MPEIHLYRLNKRALDRFLKSSGLITVQYVKRTDNVVFESLLVSQINPQLKRIIGSGILIQNINTKVGYTGQRVLYSTHIKFDMHDRRGK